jgi:transmembrane protein EpsG
MVVYIVTIALILMFGHVYSNLEAKTQQSYKGKYVLSVSILLILQSGLRNWAVGADTYQYYNRFEAVKYETWTNIQNTISQYFLGGGGKAPGYDVLQKIIQYALPHYQLFLLFIAIVFFSSMGYFIYKNTASISESVFAYVLYFCLFYNFFSITGHRQTIATAASLYGYELVKRRKLFQFLLLILLAFTIHKSVLVFIPFYFIYSVRKTYIYYWAVLLFLPILMIYKTPFLQIMQDLGGYKHFEIYEGAGTYTFSLMLLLVAIVALWRMKTVFYRNESLRPIYNAFIFALFFTPLTWVNPNAMRVVQYYSIFMLALVPAVITSFEVESKNMRKIVYMISLYLLIGLFINANINNEYKFFWQEMSLVESYK